MRGVVGVDKNWAWRDFSINYEGIFGVKETYATFFCNGFTRKLTK